MPFSDVYVLSQQFLMKGFYRNESTLNCLAPEGGRTIRNPAKALLKSERQPPIQAVRPHRLASELAVSHFDIRSNNKSIRHSANPLVSQQSSQLSSQLATREAIQSTCQHIY